MIMVTGATGNVGGALLRALISAGHSPVALTRHAPEPGSGVMHRPFDYTSQAGYERAFSGAKSAFIMTPPGQPLEASHLTAALARAKVEHVVLLSSQGAATRPESPAHAGLRTLEAALQSASIATTVLRPGGFASNSFAWIPTVRARAMVTAPFADVALPIVDPLDIAEVAATTLLNGEHRGSELTLTGPALISPRQQTAELGQAMGRQLTFQELTHAEASALMGQFMPSPIVEGTLDILGAPNAAELRISTDIERVLGKPARPYGEWATRNRHAFL
ncbi:MAG: NmrA family NAD(P)-binding protein [Polyangiaceae bacterium]